MYDETIVFSSKGFTATVGSLFGLAMRVTRTLRSAFVRRLPRRRRELLFLEEALGALGVLFTFLGLVPTGL
ncbi:hypothetical protein J19TS2_34740 [Cohnella xylanilytica]|nr:hypothetical protein J19TS2_34740 [Cohnella xylanilytica]